LPIPPGLPGNWKNLIDLNASSTAYVMFNMNRRDGYRDDAIGGTTPRKMMLVDANLLLISEESVLSKKQSEPIVALLWS
jgi:hypothetical protein